MKLKHLLLFITLLTTIPSIAQITKSDIDNAINISQLKHPYLYFSEEDKPALLERIKTRTDCNNVFKKLKAQANMWLAMPVDNNIPVQGKNTRAGWTDADNNGEYAKYYSTNYNN